MAKTKKREAKGLCKDCKFVYDLHSLNIYGRPILGRCPYEKWSVLLSDYCNNGNFKQK
jgi:hypothetical protein